MCLWAAPFQDRIKKPKSPREESSYSAHSLRNVLQHTLRAASRRLHDTACTDISLIRTGCCFCLCGTVIPSRSINERRLPKQTVAISYRRKICCMDRSSGMILFYHIIFVLSYKKVCEHVKSLRILSVQGYFSSFLPLASRCKNSWRMWEQVV